MAEFMTTAELAQMLRTSPDTIRYWRYVGKGPRSWKAGRRVLYDRKEVERWIDESRGEGCR